MKEFIVKTILSALICLGAFSQAVADERVSFDVNVPMIVSVGEPFRVEFSLNAKPDSDSFVPPSFDGFDVIAGPSISQGHSTQIINGQMSQSVSYSIIYVLLPNQAGTFRIGKGQIQVKGHSYSTSETAVEVRQGQTGDGGSEQGAERHSAASERRADNQIGKDDLLLRLVLSRSTVYKGEPVRACLKLYTRVALAGSEGAKMPTFNGFWSQELETDQGPHRETIKDRVYDAYNIAEYLLYPQESGTLTIDPAQMTVVAQVVVQSNRGFDPFFGGQDVYNVRRELKTPKVSITVKELPSGAPASFNGAVGKYTMNSELSSSQITANSAANIVVRISGSGNIGFLSSPKLEVPTSFELYDVKTTDQIKHTISGSTGQKIFEYPFIARAEGEYTLGPIAFSFFDPGTHSYVELTSDQFQVSVSPDGSASVPTAGLQTGVRKEDVTMLDSDMRVMLGVTHLHSVAAPFIFSAAYHTLVSLILVLAVSLYFILRRRIRMNRNTALVKGRKANKVAVQRLRSAARYMEDGNSRAFYEEMLKAVWGYLGDRFNIPTATLTKESIREELVRRGAEVEAQKVIDMISMCEEAQYSPRSAVNMKDVYAQGIDVVSKIESAVKR